jgi:hypothetical protein
LNRSNLLAPPTGKADISYERDQFFSRHCARSVGGGSHSSRRFWQ